MYAGYQPSPIDQIRTIAHAIGAKAPAAYADADEIITLLQDARSAGPSRDEIIEAIEDAVGDDLSGICVSRIADAVMRLCRNR